MDEKLKHLEFIHSVINRMAGNAFLLKGWAVTLVSAILAFSIEKGRPTLALLALAPCALFWFLDAYYTAHEKRYRLLFKEIAGRKPGEVDFDMNANRFTKCENCPLWVMWTWSCGVFYIGIGIVSTAVYFLTR